jgi:hypothetical protein
MEAKNSRRLENRRSSREESARWATELAARFSAAPGLDERSRILTELDLPHTLDEDAALTLYQLQPELASGFIQRHLPHGRRADDAYSPWQRLVQQAQARGDEALCFALYRTQAPSEQWVRDTNELASGTQVDPQALQNSSAAIRLDGARTLDRNWRIALRRGEDVLPYLLQHALEIWSARPQRLPADGGTQPASGLAGVVGHTGAFLRVGGGIRSGGHGTSRRPNQRAEPDGAAAPAVAGGPNFRTEDSHSPQTAAGQPALALTIDFRISRAAHSGSIWSPLRAGPLSALIELAMERGDEELIDHLFARLAVRAERSGAERVLQMASFCGELPEEAPGNEADQARRACAILRRVSQRTIRNHRDLMRRNPLARLLFERAGEACLAIEDAASDLLQAETTMFARWPSKPLANDPRALPLARQNRALLLATLERRPSTDCTAGGARARPACR